MVAKCSEESEVSSELQSFRTEFGLYEDENGIVRCKGRIAHVDLPFET